MSPLIVNYLRKSIQKFVDSISFIPAVFFLLNLPLCLGLRTFTHDTGDGIAAFKFWTLSPQYWNWFESGGQPFWHDLSTFRLHDPLHWPLLLLLKSLPIPTLASFNLFILFRISLIGVGIELLNGALGFSKRTGQLIAFIALFSGLGASIYEQLGMHDIVFPFLFFLWASLKLHQTQQTKYIIALGLVSLHCSMSYHIFYLIPIFFAVFIVCAILKPRELKFFSLTLKSHYRGIITISFATLLALFSMKIATTDPNLLPVLRNMTYGSFVNSSGENITSGFYRGRNLLKQSQLKVSPDECNRTMHCSFYKLNYLKSFLTGSPAFPGIISAEYSGYLGRITLVVALIGLFTSGFLKNVMLVNLVLSLVLSLGNQTPLWSFVQRVFPPLSYTRHTHFYLAIFSITILGLFAIGFERLRNNPFPKRKTVLCLLSLGIITEGLLYHFTEGFRIQEVTLSGQNELISKPLPEFLTSREFRLSYPASVPRSGAATTFSTPSALESVLYGFGRPPRIKDGELDFVDIQTIGFVTPFLLKHTFSSRLLLSTNPNAFKRAFGVFPYGVFTLYPLGSIFTESESSEETLHAIETGKLLIPKSMETWLQSRAVLSPLKSAEPSQLLTRADFNSEPVPVRLNKDKLVTSVDLKSPQIAYLSLPFPHIRSILIDGVSTPFFQANIFGIAFLLTSGRHKITIIADVARGGIIIQLYYSAFLILFGYGFMAIRKERKLLPNYVRDKVKTLDSSRQNQFGS